MSRAGAASGARRPRSMYAPTKSIITIGRY